ncbi:MAG: hypothetical protein ACRDT4_08710 [Micromonosporaceae bacterium]
MSVRRAGLGLIASGLVTAVGATFTVTYPAVVPDTAASYPYPPMGHVVAQLIWTGCFALVLAGTLGLRASGLAGTGALARAGLSTALVGAAGVTVFNLGFAFVAYETVDAPAVMGLGIGIWLSSVLTGVGYLLAGIAVLRAGVWHGWQAFTPLVVGGFVFVVLLPFSVVAPALFQWPLAAWGLCFALHGLALYQERVPAPATRAR